LVRHSAQHLLVLRRFLPLPEDGAPKSAKAAFSPVPSLQEIDQQLRQEFPGCEPSLADLIAVESRIKSERNEAAVFTVGLLIGVHWAALQTQGGPLL
jgi:hypothetical protein